jgi:transposase
MIENAVYRWKNIAKLLGVSVSKAKTFRKDLKRAGIIFYTYMGRPPRKVVGAFPPLLRVWITEEQISVRCIPLYGWREIGFLFGFSERKMRSYRRELKKEKIIHYEYGNLPRKVVFAYSSDLMIWATKKSQKGEILKTLVN